MEAKFWNFEKRENSLKIPSGDPVATVNCVLKSPEGKDNLALECRGVPRNANYCYVDGTNRYYFVTDTEFLSGDITRFYLDVDVLASFADDLKNMSAYILRAASEFDNGIVDNYYPMTAGTSQLRASATFIPLATPSFILSVIGNDEGEISNTSGVARYYLLSAEELAQLMTWIFAEENYQDEITDQVVKTFFNPSQYLIKCMYCPFASASGGDTTVKLGWWDTNISAKELNPSSPITIDQVSLLVRRPQEDDNDYRNYSPFARYRMYIPFVGLVDIADHLLNGVPTIRISGKVDICTGELMLKLTSPSGKVITYLSAQGCVELPIAQSSLAINPVSIISTGLEGILDATGLSNTGFGGAVADIANAATNSQKQVSQKTSAGNSAQRLFESNAILMCDYADIVDTDYDNTGRPLCAVRRIGAMSGYIKTLNFRYASAYATLAEIRAVENYFNGGGVYVE